ncbi:TPA: hypothetical protein DEO28_02630 [Candidatus Dependentiae bacterium]|nr:MAG: hypothetical protein UR14_C0005G0117 [candidate division TM6 bacterium GW2011_GWE2_31_21]KKP53194.1 MAG: hypothetical protein UR43_C0007G0118 [candidate division TM6 bacterium GW2011_GWF2_33_332]HBS48012.1 hypothetical protein [Candidatus Dependentiae bacterium]HBZ73384.1 hypothetical protein [Candidatus Dependentiae bacterium]
MFKKIILLTTGILSLISANKNLMAKESPFRHRQEIIEQEQNAETIQRNALINLLAHAIFLHEREMGHVIDSAMLIRIANMNHISPLDLTAAINQFRTRHLDPRYSEDRQNNS